MFSLICVWINGWVNNSEAGDLRRHRGLYDVIVMSDLFVRTYHSRASDCYNMSYLSETQLRLWVSHDVFLSYQLTLPYAVQNVNMADEMGVKDERDSARFE